MLRISKLTDYGVVLVTHLATCEGAHSVKVLARETGLPAPTTSKVLKRLSRAELVQSVQGPRGGYLLSRNPDEVSVLDVIDAMEGPVALTQCVQDEPNTECAHEGSCGVESGWRLINQTIRSALAEISLAEISSQFVSDLIPVSQMKRNQRNPEERN